MTSSHDLRSEVKKSLPQIVEQLNKYLRGEKVDEIKHILEREGRGGKLPHWYELLNSGKSMPNLDGKTIGSVIEMTLIGVLEKHTLAKLDIPDLEINPAKGVDIHTYLSDLASAQPVGAHGLVALDWQSGNRSTLVDHQLSGLIMGLTLSTKPEEIYRAIVESTAYGARKIVQTFNESGVPVKEFIAAGGLIKNRFVMQIYADVLNMPITIIKSAQGPALGSAIHAAVAAGAYKDVQSAAAAMGGVAQDRYQPIAANAKVYDQLYKHYNELYESFGHNGAMHSLRAIRDHALTSTEGK